jgi:lactate permease
MEAFNFLLALLPIIWLGFALIALKMPAFKAAFGSLILAGILAVFVWKLSVINTVTAGAEGFLMALWPIILVILAAVFTYRMSLHTGNMDTIKQMITSVCSDKRVLVLLIAWCFGGFMEGMAGFGTAIAIPASMLVSLGFEPIFSCLVCLIANGTPTPFGSIGIPTVTLANLVGLDNTGLSFMTTLQLSLFMIACPILIVMVTGKGVKALKGMLPITLASGLSFVLPQLLVAKFIGAELAVVIGSVCSLLVTILLGRKKKPDPEYELKLEKTVAVNGKKAFLAWSPFIFIFIFLLCTSKLVGPVNTFLSQFSSVVTVYTGEKAGKLTFAWINTPGVWIFLSAILGGLLQGAKLKNFIIVLKETLMQMKETMITMLCVLGCAKIMGYSGMITTIAAFAIAATGSLYPLFAPWIGALGTFVTGSGTNSGVLFGGVQMKAAETLQVNPYWMVALNSLGVAAGKMISPQSLAIALASVNAKGQDSKLMSKIMPYAFVFLILMSVLAYVGTMLMH